MPCLTRALLCCEADGHAQCNIPLPQPNAAEHHHTTKYLPRLPSLTMEAKTARYQVNITNYFLRKLKWQA
jgi:hypothetical protein